MLKRNGENKEELINSMMFQESAIAPQGDEIFRSTNKQILDLFPSIQHKVSNGFNSN